MSMTIAPAPIKRSIRVKATPAKAFDMFTAGMGRWWIKSHSINKASPIKAVIVEPKVGGAWFEQGEDGSKCTWGKVLAWDPPSRLVLSWQIDAHFQYDPSLETEVEIRFVPFGEETEVQLEHRNLDRFGAAAEQIRGIFESPGGWPGLLSAFASEI
jgi:uncharacterized protein YndB with AHSA1/START domain